MHHVPPTHVLLNRHHIPVISRRPLPTNCHSYHRGELFSQHYSEPTASPTARLPLIASRATLQTVSALAL